MIRNSFILKFLALAALIAFFASPATAERLTKRISQGNNIGITVKTGWGMPWTSEAWQFPRGTSNLIQNDGCTIGIGVAQDLDGDGVAEDTTGINHVRATMPELASLESMALIEAIAATGVIMDGEMTKSEYSRIWTNLDAEELADWPIEGRIPRGDPNGVPDVAAGGETIFFHSGDPFMGWGFDPGCTPPGGAMEWTLRFLDFAESNNMMYVNIFLRNMSEYVKYNHHAEYGPRGQAHPDGWTWKGQITVANFRNWAFGGDPAGWALHAEKRIYGTYGLTSTTAAFSPPKSPLVGFKMINPPHTADQMADMTSLHHHDWCSEFGFAGHKQMFVGFPWGTTYKVALDLETGYYPGVINPWTGKQVRGAWPGMLHEDDARYSQWIWAGPCYFMSYPCYGELLDIAPRDTVVWDAAYMFTYPGVESYVTPELDIANIDDPMMQEMLAPLEDYAVIAEIVINSGYKLPETPRAPPLTIIPGDREVTITWSDVNLQTPDTYYYFLEEEGLNPQGYYKEYDFEGFRFYRSFVGPSDSHSELLADYNLSSGNVQFYYIDKMQDDTGRWRMRDGMKVWYAMVPYDRNYDTATGEMFSLPDPASGKTWNRPGAELYTVVPRSDASNFNPASVTGFSYVPRSGPSVTPVDAPTAELSGDGTGKLTQAPVYLAPQVGTVSLVPINSERIAQDISVYLECTELDWSGCVYPSSDRTFQLVEGSKTGLPLTLFVRQRADPQSETFSFNGPVDSDGMSYAVSAEFLSLKQGDFRSKVYYNIETGGYTEAEVTVMEGRCSTGRPYGTQPAILSFAKSARITVTWKDAGGGNLTLEVQDVTHGEAIPYGPYYDDLGWGLIKDGEWGRTMNKFEGTLIYELYLPREERTVLMSETFPADNTDDFGIWLNGAVWRFSSGGAGFTSMPAVGTVMTVDFCMGSWNDDQTVFTMNADPPWPGDKWKIDVKAMSMNPEDADLSKIRVVPNPYMASSFLDLSINGRRIEFVNLPDKCTIRIYTLSGNLVNVLNHIGASRQGWGNYTNWDRINAQTGEPAVYTGYDNHSGTEPWNLRNRFGQTVASGLYFFHVTDQRGETHTGKFYIVN
jgi:hypothetical protein